MAARYGNIDPHSYDSMEHREGADLALRCFKLAMEDERRLHEVMAALQGVKL